MIKSWIRRHWFIRRIVRSAMEQYYEFKQLDPGLSENEIVCHIFKTWFLNPEKKYPPSQKNKIERYHQAHFYPNNLLELCLISLDIKENINPGSSSKFDRIAKLVKNQMVEYNDVYKYQPLMANTMNKENIYIRIINFTGSWYEKFL